MRWVRGQTIRARITIWSVLVGAVLFSVAALAFRGAINSIVTTSTRTLLSSDAAPFEALIRQDNTTTFPAAAEDQLVAVVDPTGKERASDLPDSLADHLGSLVAFQHGLHVVQTSGGHEYYVSIEEVKVPGGAWHIVTARNRDAGAVVLRGLDAALIVGAIALVAGFGVATWIVTGLALRPVTRMREEAKLLARTSSGDTLLVGPARDELSALAETLNALITTVRDSADRERQMVADASHELRTPIAVLTTQLQLAHLSHGDADALEREIESAQQTLQRLATLTQNLLTLSRIEASNATVSTPGAEVAAEFLASMDRAIILGSANGVLVEFTEQARLDDVSVPMPLVDFAGLIDNLVSNAIKASPRGASVDVLISRRGGTLELVVADSGHGIDDDFIPVAFDRFSRAESSRDVALGGNGLGLAIVKAAVSRAGGTVRLESRPSGGVRATAILPITAATETTVATDGATSEHVDSRR